MLKVLMARVRHELWEVDIDQRTRPMQFTVRVGQAAYNIVRKFADGQFSLQAMSLVYTTLLSLVPLLAVSFSVLTAFGAGDRLEPLLLEFLEPLGERGIEINAYIQEFVSNLRVGVLGFVGLAMLFYTVSSLIYKIELALNSVWHVANARSLARRFSDYFSAVLIGPVLLVVVLGLCGQAIESDVMQWIFSITVLGPGLQELVQYGTYLLICGAFAFIYGFLPNTRVRLGAALVGGLFAGVLWYASGKLFAQFIVASSNYSVIYSGFAGAVLFMLWLYISWLIVLVGGQVAAFWQNPHFLDMRHENSVLDNRRREELALDIMTLVGRAHYQNLPACTLEVLEKRHHDIQAGHLKSLLQVLIDKRYIVANSEEPPGYLPACDIGTISLSVFFAAIRGEQGINTSLSGVDGLMAEVDAAMAQTLGERSIKDLITVEERRPANIAEVKQLSYKE